MLSKIFSWKQFLLLMAIMSIFKVSVAQTFYQKLGEWQIDNTINNAQLLPISYSTSDKIMIFGSGVSNGTPGSMNISYQGTCNGSSDFLCIAFDTSMVFNFMFRLGGLGEENSIYTIATQKYHRDTILLIGASVYPDTGCDIHSLPHGGVSDIWAVISDTLGNVKNERLIGTSTAANEAARSSVFLDTCIIMNMSTDPNQFPNGDLWNSPPPCINCPPPPGGAMLNLSTFNYSLQKTHEKYIGPATSLGIGDLLYDSIGHFIYLFVMVNTTQPNVMNVSEAGTGNDVWIVKMDEQLNVVWDKRLITAFDEQGIGKIKLLPNGHFLVAGITDAYYGSGLQGIHRGGKDLFLYEVDTSGVMVNDRCYGTLGNEAGGRVSVLSNGMIMIALSTGDGVSGDKTEPSRGGSDAWFLFLDSNLNIVYQKTIGGNNLDMPHSFNGNSNGDEFIYEWPDGSILVSLYSRSGVSGDKTIPASTPSNPSNSDIWLVRFRPGLLTGLEDVPTVITTPFVFPNPANNAITLQVEQAKSYRVMQLDGRELISGTNSPPNAFTIDCSTWSSGVYFVEVIQQNGTRWLNKVVKE